jgi:hypothetical protein
MKLTDRQLVERALVDAIDWQLSFADAYPRGAPERTEALKLARQYRALRQKRYGESRQPIEIALEGTVAVSVFGPKFWPKDEP